MGYKWKVPSEARPGGKNWRALPIGQSTGFITFDLGEHGIKRLLLQGSDTTLKWIANNAFQYEQKEAIQGLIRERENGTGKPHYSVSKSPSLRSEDGGAAPSSGANNLTASSLFPDISFSRSPSCSLPGTPPAPTISLTNLSSTDDSAGLVMNPPNPPRPALKLKLSNLNTQQTNEPETPNPQSAVRTPSIKLKFGSKPGSAVSPPPAVKGELEDGTTPSSSKKRKRTSVIASEAGIANGTQKAAPVRKISLFTSQTPKSATATPGIRLKTKGKIPKRPLGVGYDSELEEREADPVILEAFVLRMMPGDDANYIRESIEKGLVGVSRLQGGADIRLRFLDSNGRRGVMFVRGNQYAITIVDLPTITEGMKSWDKKNFMKSVDISQMCLVLGPCKSDEEAREYKLPPEINPKNYQYAHGLTAPMKNVRKRRFERTARARVDDIEHVEKKVQALLQADAAAGEAHWEVLDYDPRLKRDEYSPEYDSEQDAEAEEDGYFPNGAIAETPDYAETPQQAEVTAEDVEDYEKLFEVEDDGGDGGNGDNSAITLNRSEAFGSPAITSSVSPSATAAPTPTGEADAESSDEDDDEDEDADEERREGDDQRSQTLDRIRDIENTIRETKAQLKKQTNQIFLRKLAQKITNLQNDVDMMKQSIGMDVDGEGDD